MLTLDQLLLIAILAGVALVLVVLLRQTAHAEQAEQTALAPPPSAVVMPSVEPAVAPAPPEVVETVSEAPVPTNAPPPTSEPPMERVLKLLQEKESLTTAFVLREILDKPLSLRGK
jgi:hypothetical protein